MMRLKIVIALLCALATAPLPALAVNPNERLDDPALEARARALSAELRCLVCQNESIDASEAELARDLRVLVRERLVAGDTDDEVLDFLVARYGEFVLLRPRFAAHTLVLWLSPFAILLVGVGYIMLRRRRTQTASTASTALNADEEKALQELLEREKPGPSD
ncbi:MAG: cytochrome c-type biogenesis protein [Pseudomonadota bacterium]